MVVLAVVLAVVLLLCLCVSVVVEWEGSGVVGLIGVCAEVGPCRHRDWWPGRIGRGGDSAL